jgi:hypothetical protein
MVRDDTNVAALVNEKKAVCDPSERGLGPADKKAGRLPGFQVPMPLVTLY